VFLEKASLDTLKVKIRKPKRKSWIIKIHDVSTGVTYSFFPILIFLPGKMSIYSVFPPEK
jgi:hypothetical protein